jgi:hypothetical protein
MLKNNSDSALKYSTMASEISDQIHSEENIRLVQKMKFEEEARQKDIATELVDQKNKRRYNLTMFGVAIFIVAFFGTLILVSKRKVNRRALKFLGLAGLIFVFEFISQFVHPYIGNFTKHEPLLVFVASVCLAALLIPVHEKLQNWVKNVLAKRKRKTPVPNEKLKTRTSGERRSRKKKTADEINVNKQVE